MLRTALFWLSRWTRDFTNRKCGEVCSGNFLGLQIELNFVPVYRAVALGPVRLRPKAERSEDGIEFFDARKLRKSIYPEEISGLVL